MIETIVFDDFPPIHVDVSQGKCYKRVRSYDQQQMNRGKTWHQIVVLHKGKSLRKKDILNAIFHAVEPNEFFPIGYRPGPRYDKFLVRSCKAALEKLFEHNLSVQLPNGEFLPLEVQLNVATYEFSHISAERLLEKALRERYNNYVTVGNVSNVLDLSNFEQHPAFQHMVMRLGNIGVLQRVCEMININDDQMRVLDGMILRHNGIYAVTPLKMFTANALSLLDLRDNNILSGNRLCQDLENIYADDLLLAGNPLLKKQNYPQCLRPVLKNFKRIDHIKVENLERHYTPLVNEDLNTDTEGYEITLNNVQALEKFRNSKDWHAIIIPDPRGEYSKDIIVDYFFLRITPECNLIFPCYYRFEKGEHMFLLRECFEEIKYLLEVLRLEMTLPCIDEDATVTSDITVKYKLIMNIRKYENGQVNISECLDDALDHCFNPMDRLLNMENFQNCNSLKNVIVNLSNPNILNKVLIMASRKFLTNCVELRLGYNKILGIHCGRSLTLMKNLRAIDLGNNWIHDLSDISDLKVLQLKVLRLDGNPLCSKYKIAVEYISHVKRYFRDLTKLDNVDVSSKSYEGCQKNYVCDLKSYSLIDFFVPKYYKIYDLTDRSLLKYFYDQNALLTMTCHYEEVRKSSELQKRLEPYEKNSRNIFKIEDMRRAYSSVHYGPDEIMRVLKKLPKAQHDICSFNSDAIYYNQDCMVLTLSGVFKDLSQGGLGAELLLGFTRTFVIRKNVDQLGAFKCATEYCIINEQLSIYKPTEQQVKSSFLYESNRNKELENKQLTENDQISMIVLFQDITGLKTVWSRRCLEHAEWNFEKALLRFKELCEKNEIKPESFN